jgi:hypothetical protein
VEVIDGSRAGTIAMTDESGHFSMPGTFTGNITLTASKDGYVRETRPVAPIGAPLPGTAGGSWEVAFHLEPLGPSVNVAGAYTLTLTADSACTNLPAEARMRTYTVTIVPGGRSSSFSGRLSGARFLPWVPCPPYPVSPTCTYNGFGIGMAGDYASISVNGIVEQVGETAYLAFNAGAEGSFGSTGITIPLSGSFLYCPSEPYQIDIGEWACRANAGVDCYSRNHQLALVRR